MGPYLSPWWDGAGPGLWGGATGGEVARIHGWIKPCGAFLANWATEEWEGEEEEWEGWGAPMWWSHYGAEENLGMLRAAGFEIERAETVSSGGETWLWVLARKGGRALPSCALPPARELDGATRAFLAELEHDNRSPHTLHAYASDLAALHQYHRYYSG